MSDKKISDIPQVQEPLDEVRSFLHLKKVFQVFKPLLKLIGVDIGSIEGALADIERREREANELMAVLDQFNDIFGPKGWIVYEYMDAKVAEKAIKKYK